MTIEEIRIIKRNHLRMQELKQKLAETDFQAIKYAEGEMTEEEYEPIKQQRKVWRKEYNELEREIKELEDNNNQDE